MDRAGTRLDALLGISVLTCTCAGRHTRRRMLGVLSAWSE